MPSSPQPLDNFDSVHQRRFVDELLDDQLARWNRDDRVSVESYVERFEVLRANGELLLDLIDHEILLRQQAGERPELVEYLARFPALARDIQIQFAFHGIIQAERPGAIESGFTTEDLAACQTQFSGSPKREPETSGSAPSPAAASRPLPVQLGPYRILSEIGTGAMGTVYEAEDPLLRRRVAVKVIRPEISADETSRRRFLREAQAAAAISHENVVSVYHVGEDAGRFFLAMPRLHGETLEQRLQRDGSLPVDEALHIGHEVSLGLDAAHTLGLLHRDIKPANLWLERDTGRVKILDFGLAQVALGEQSLTQEGTLLGTPAYMSPEQAESREPGPGSDLFSLGCVLYHALVGQPPFARAGLLATLSALAQAQIRAPHERRPEIPRDVSAAVMRLLERDPAHRPESAAAVAEELAGLRQGSAAPVVAPPTSINRRSLYAAIGTLLVLSLLGMSLIPGLIQIQTRDGVLSVETVDDGVQLVVTGEKGDIRLMDLKKNRTLRLQPGRYTLRIRDERQGLEIDTAEFSLSRDGRHIAHVVYKPSPETSNVPPPPEPPESDVPAGQADRNAARWATSIGGTVTLVTSKGEKLTIKSGSLPEVPFGIESIRFDGNPLADDDGLRHLQGLKWIKTLVLRSCPHVTDAGVKHVEALTRLEHLDLGATGVTDRIWPSLGRLTSLKHLCLFACPNLRGEGIAELQHLQTLQQLDLRWVPISNQNLQTLGPMPALVRLVLGASMQEPWTAVMFEHLGKAVPQLESLDLCGGNSHQVDLAWVFQNFLHLRYLNCHGRQLEQLDWNRIERLPQLKSIEISEAVPLNSQLSRFTTLERIVWSGVKGAVDSGSPGVRPEWFHPGVQQLEVTGSRFGDGIGTLLKPFPNVRTVSLMQIPAFAAEDVAVLAGLTQLQTLTIWHECEAIRPFLESFRSRRPDVRITGTGVPAGMAQPGLSSSSLVDINRRLANWVHSLGGAVTLFEVDGGKHRYLHAQDPLPPGRFSIMGIELYRQDISQSQMLELARLRGLGRLRLGNSRLDPQGIAEFCRSAPPGLRTLGLQGTSLSGAALEPIRNLPILSELLLDHDQLRATDVIALPDTLQTLVIGDGNDDDLARLANCSQLRTIWCYTERPIEEFHQVVGVETVHKLQASNQRVRVVVGSYSVARCLGPEPHRDAVARLSARGIAIQVRTFPGENTSEPVTDARLASPQPFTAFMVEIPPDHPLHEEDLQLLSHVHLDGKLVARRVQSPEPLLRLLQKQTEANQLDFVGAALEDGHLELLKPMRWLRHLDIRGTSVSQAGVEALHQALPVCYVDSKFGGFEPLYGVHSEDAGN